MERHTDAETESSISSFSDTSSGSDEEDKQDKVDNAQTTEEKPIPQTKSLGDVFNGVSPQEVEELREKLNEGYFENYFSWTFWNALHSNHGSTLGYAFGFLLILLLNYQWMLEEFVDSTEGHSVAKTFVILFVIYSYSFITMGFEFVQLSILLMELYVPNHCREIQANFNKVMNMSGNLKKLRQSKYFCLPAVILWCLFTASIGSSLWNWFWWNHICKSYHDRTCRGSWLGQLVIKYRDDACYDGTASSMICERFVSYLPIMLFSVFNVFLGNVFLPLMNDWLSAYYPLSENLENAFALIDQLDDSATSTSNDKPVVAGFSKSKAIEENRILCNNEHGKCSEALCKCINEDVSLLYQPKVKVGMNYVKNIIPTVTGVCLLLALDWIIVKKFFPK